MALEDELNKGLAEREADGLRRSLRALPTHDKYIEVDGERLLNLAGNDYLGLSRHPRLIAAAKLAIEEHGVGAGASRLVTGTLSKHEAAERHFAAFKHAEAALLLPTGYMANLAVLGALARAGDLVCQDKLNHASLIDAANFSVATVRTYPHLQTEKLERLLAQHRADAPDARRFIVTDSVFSMDGDCADLPALCAIADRYDAVLVADEAHGTGVLGNTGAGLAEHQGVVRQLYTCGAGGVVVSTASKALGGLGGMVTGSQAVIDTLVNHARPFMYSTAVPPAQAAVVAEAVDVVSQEPERRVRLAGLIEHTRAVLTRNGWLLPTTSAATPILPLVVGDEQAAIDLSSFLRRRGLLTVPIRPPTVARGQARVRVTLRADLTDTELADALEKIGRPM